MIMKKYIFLVRFLPEIRENYAKIIEKNIFLNADLLTEFVSVLFDTRESGTFKESCLLPYRCFGRDQKWARRLESANE
jgi:hypothetical protein